MTRILMAVYGITAEQAAARIPAAQFAITAVLAAAFVWLDSVGALDGLSPSSRRAWIEIAAPVDAAARWSVALLAEGVDRNFWRG